MSFPDISKIPEAILKVVETAFSKGWHIMLIAGLLIFFAILLFGGVK